MKKKSMKLNAVLNGIRQCCTMLFPLITIPYVSRILGAENYGKINFGSSIASYFILIGAFGVNAYAIREGAKIRNDHDRYTEFASEVFSVNMLTTAFSYLLLLFLLLFWGKVQDYRLLICIQTLPIIFTTLGIDWNNNIFEDFAYTTIRYIIVQIVSIILMFVFVRTSDDYIKYALITAAANIGGCVVNYFYIRKNYVKVRFTLKMKLKQHFMPMFYLFSNAIASTVYVNSDVTILTLLKGDSVTGIYSIAVKIYTIIKQFINAVVGVALPRLSFYLGQGMKKEYNALLTKLLHCLMLLILPSMIGLIMVGRKVIILIAGEEFQTGYVALCILAVAIVFAVLSFLYVYGIMIPYGYEKKCLVSTIVAAITNVVLNFFFIPAMSLNGAAITTVISEAIVLCMSMYFTRGLYEINITWRMFFPCGVGCIAVFAVCLVVEMLNLPVMISLIVAIMGSCIIYGTVLLMLGDEVAQDMGKNILRKFSR